MRAILGLLLIMLCLAMAVVWMPENDGERQLAAVTAIATQGLPRHTGAPPAAPQNDARTFSPKAPLISATQQPSTVADAQSRTIPTVTIYDQSAEAPRADAAVAAAATMSVVTGTFASPTQVAPDRAAATSSVLRPQPAATISREDLVRDLQRGLRRVGCYWGEIDGSWGTGSKRAMGTFMDRVNASLPIEQPDFILLTLLQSQTGLVCGKDCPSGQTLYDNGRCMPNAVVARANRTAERKSATREARDAPEQPAAQNSQWAAIVQRETPQTSALAPLAAGAGAAAVAVTPLPGRMAIGGPGAGAYVSPPGAPPQAFGAVRAAEEAERPAAISRKRDRQAAAQGRPARPLAPMPAPPYGYRYYAPPAYVYRTQRAVAPPRYYASAPRRATVSRGWTATFFNQ